MDEFDIEAGGTYVYPINYPMRDYQFEIVKAALFNNTLVCLPTGLGKTFIGAVLMYNFYRWYPTGKVVFMAPTKPLVAQQIEACHEVMGIPQEHTAEMTGLKSPEVRTKLWKTQRVFFLTPQVIMNDLSRGACPDKSIKLLVVDEAHRALGQHSYCQVIQLLQQQNCTFRVLALSATPGTDLKAVTQVIANLCIAHIELRNEDSPDILKYVHKRSIEKIVIPIEGELKNIREKFYEILRPHVSKLIDKRLVYTKDEKTFSQYQVLLARDAFRKNPPSNISHREKGIYEGIFAVCATLYHANELLIMHGIKSFYNFLKESENKSTNYMLKAEFKNNSNLRKLLEYINDLFYSPICKTNSEKVNFMNSKIIPTSHPKIDKLCEILLKHFKEFNKNKESTRVIIFSQYRDSVQEITRVLEQIDPVISPISFIGQSSGQVKGLTQKEQLKVVKGFREGNYNTLIATCVGEEGLDIGEVDLIICYDAPKSAIRLVQRMGRTGRKREGKIIVLVTTGKEEKDYNQSQYQRRCLVNTLMKGDKLKQHLYCNNPRMVPKDINPVCLKLHMKVIDWEAPSCKQKILKKGKRSINAFFKNFDGDKHKTNETFMNALELKKYETNFKVEDDSLIKKISKPRFHRTTDASSADVSIGKDEFDFSMYQPWYTTLQPRFILSHSKQANHLVELTDFISMQEALGDNNSYEDELAPYMEYSFFKKATEINKLKSNNHKNLVKKNVFKKQKHNLVTLSKKGISPFLNVKNSQFPKLASEKSKFSQDNNLMNFNKQDLIEISDEEINSNFSNGHEDINMNNLVLPLENSVDHTDQNSCLLKIYKNDQKWNKLHVMDEAFDFSLTYEICNHNKVNNFPAAFQVTGKLFSSISLSPYIKQINAISDYYLFEKQNVTHTKFSMAETFHSAQNLKKNINGESVSSMIEADFLESIVPHHVAVSTKHELLVSEQRSDHDIDDFKNKLDFNSSFDKINTKKDNANLTHDRNYDLETSSILLTPPESKMATPSNSNCTFNLDSPIFFAKQKFPNKPSVYTSTPRPISKAGFRSSPIKSANVTPILTCSKVLCDSNGITNNIIITSKLAEMSDLTVKNPYYYQNLDSDSDVCLPIKDDLFAEIDLKSLVKRNGGGNGSSFDHKMVKYCNVTDVKSTSKLSPGENKRENSFKSKLNMFRRDDNNKNVSPHNPNKLLSVTQVIDIVNMSTVHDASWDNACGTKDVDNKLSSQFHLNPLDNIKPKIVKNLNGQFKSSTGVVTKGLTETLSQNSLKPKALSKSSNTERKYCKDDLISCNQFDIVGPTCRAKALSCKGDNILKCNDSEGAASVQFDISLDLSSDSDEHTEITNHDTPPNFANRCSKTLEIREHGVSSIYKPQIQISNSLNAHNSDISKEDQFSSDDEIFGNLDVLALEKNLNEPDSRDEFNNKICISLNRSKPAISKHCETTLINLENKSNINMSELSLPTNTHDFKTGGVVSVLSHVQSGKNSCDILPSTSNRSCIHNESINCISSVQRETCLSELDSTLAIKKTKKVNVLDSSAENSYFHDSTSKSFNESSDGCIGNLISTTSSSDDFVDSSVYHPEQLVDEKENLKKIKKCRKKKKPSNCGLLLVEAEESDDSVKVSEDENESHLDRYEQSFVDDETQAVEQNIDMRAVYLQSVKSPLKKTIKFSSKEALLAQDIFSQPQSGLTSEESEEDSFVVANDFVEYESEHLDITENPEDSILNQVLRASIETAKEESKKRKCNKRKRILMNISSEDEDLCPSKLKIGKKDEIFYSADEAVLKDSDDIIVPKNQKKNESVLYDTNNINKKAAIDQGRDKGLDFQLLTSDDEEDWLEIPLKDESKNNLKQSTSVNAINPIKHVETDIKNSCSKSLVQFSCHLSPKFASKHLPQTNANFKTNLPHNSDSVKSLKPVTSGMTSKNYNVNTPVQCPKEYLTKPDKVSLNNSSSCKNKLMAATDLSLSFKDTISTQSQVLNSQQFTDAEVCILVDSCEIGIAGLVSSLLRSNYNLQTYIVQVSPASYVLSSRMAVYRLSNTAFACIANKTKLITRIRNLLSVYCRPVLIVEKDRKSGMKPVARTSYLDSISCAFVQLPQLKVIYTEDQKSTAETIWHLMKLERLKGYCIPKFSPGDLHFEQTLKFYRTVPQLPCSCAIFLVLNYPTIRDAVNSDLKELMKRGKMTAEVATAFRSHFTRAFRKDMLPMSYQLEST